MPDTEPYPLFEFNQRLPAFSSDMQFEYIYIPPDREQGIKLEQLFVHPRLPIEVEMDWRSYQDFGRNLFRFKGRVMTPAEVEDEITKSGIDPKHILCPSLSIQVDRNWWSVKYGPEVPIDQVIVATLTDSTTGLVYTANMPSDKVWGHTSMASSDRDAFFDVATSWQLLEDIPGRIQHLYEQLFPKRCGERAGEVPLHQYPDDLIDKVWLKIIERSNGELAT